MNIQNANLENLITKFRKHDKDTGSYEVQIINLTDRILRLTQHLQKHRKDHDAKREVVRWVALRKRFVKALQSDNVNSYAQLIKDLGIRG